MSDEDRPLEESAPSEPDEDFASMFEASLQAKHVRKGQTIEGTIVAIGADVAFVDVGGKGEALIEIAHLKDDEGVLEVAVGDRIQATVVSTEGGLTLSRRLVRGAATARQLEDAFRTGLPVEGRVERSVKGGYEVRVARQRAFCPMSQIDIIRNTTPAAHEGRVYAFRIIEYKEGGKNIIVSRRALLEEEQRAGAAEIRQSIVVGAVLRGRVTAVREFGAFVDLGAGVQGLLHASEMGWSRVSDASQVVTPGEEITVKVLRVDDEMQKIALGLKQLSADPWATVQAGYEVGQVALAEEGSARAAGVAPPQSGLVPGARLTGKVARHESFGVFVFVAPGRTGLMPLSETGIAREADVAKTFPVGTDIEVVVLEVDPSGRRIRLSRKAVLDAREAEEVREYTERADVAPPEGFGLLADKLRGALKSRGT